MSEPCWPSRPRCLGRSSGRTPRRFRSRPARRSACKWQRHGSRDPDLRSSHSARYPIHHRPRSHRRRFSRRASRRRLARPQSQSRHAQGRALRTLFQQPSDTRVVLDLTQPQSYQISTTQTSTTQNTVVVKLGSPNSGPAQSGPAVAERIPPAPAAKLQNATLAADTNAARAKVAAARVSTAVANAPLLPVTEAPPPPQPPVTVTFVNGMLTIRADKATLAQVLFEVQRQTQAEIAIPAGASRNKSSPISVPPRPAMCSPRSSTAQPITLFLLAPN